MKVSEVSNNQPTSSEQSKTRQIESTSQKDKVDLQAGEEETKEQKTDEKKVTEENVKDGIEKLNETVQTFHEELKFEMHKESERMMTKVVNTEKLV